MTNYWKTQEIKAREALLDKTIDEVNSLMKSEYLRISKELIEKLTTVYGIILGEGDAPLASHLYQYQRYYELLVKVENELQKLGVKQNTILDNHLVSYYEDNSKIIGEPVNFFTDFNEDKVKQTVKEAWVNDGLTYSDRIWNDKRALTEKIKNTLADAIATGKSSGTLTEELMKDFGVSYNNARRLVRTELAHTQIRSTIDTYKKLGITKYRILSEKDCCDECSSINEKVYPIEDEDHLPPEHPNCRCTVLSVQ